MKIQSTKRSSSRRVMVNHEIEAPLNCTSHFTDGTGFSLNVAFDDRTYYIELNREETKELADSLISKLKDTAKEFKKR